MPEPYPVYIETGKTWAFAAAIDWPGWCRRGKSEDGAIETLLAYAPRYRAAVGRVFTAGPVRVIGRIEGDASTDFGVPHAIGPWDSSPLTQKEADTQIAILEAAWRAFDQVVAGAPAELRKGPRGGGRDRDKIVEHVRDAERAYAPRIGVRVPPRTPWPDQRALLVAGLKSPGAGTKWPARYGLRRIAWHVLDHAWEIEDRSD